MGAKGNTCRISVRKPEGKRPLGRPRRRREDNIEMELKGVGWSGMNWSDLTQERERWSALVNTAMNHRLLKKGSVPWS
jgi:hypothetical protein